MGSGAALSLAVGLMLVLRASGGATAVASVATPVTPSAPTTEPLAPATAGGGARRSAARRRRFGQDRPRGQAPGGSGEAQDVRRPPRQAPAQARSARDQGRPQAAHAGRQAHHDPTAPAERGDPRPPLRTRQRLAVRGRRDGRRSPPTAMRSTTRRRTPSATAALDWPTSRRVRPRRRSARCTNISSWPRRRRPGHHLAPHRPAEQERRRQVAAPPRAADRSSASVPSRRTSTRRRFKRVRRAVESCSGPWRSAFPSPSKLQELVALAAGQLPAGDRRAGRRTRVDAAEARATSRSRLRRSLGACTAEGLVAEVVSACAGGAILTGWAIHLHASALLTGLVVALPQMAQLFQLPAAWSTALFGRRRAAVALVAVSRQVMLPLARPAVVRAVGAHRAGASCSRWPRCRRCWACSATTRGCRGWASSCRGGFAAATSAGARRCARSRARPLRRPRAGARLGAAARRDGRDAGRRCSSARRPAAS